MKKRVRQLIAGKLHRKAAIKLILRNLALIDKLTEELQNRYLDELRALDEEIQMLESVLKKLN